MKKKILATLLAASMLATTAFAAEAVSVPVERIYGEDVYSYDLVLSEVTAQEECVIPLYVYDYETGESSIVDTAVTLYYMPADAIISYTANSGYLDAYPSTAVLGVATSEDGQVYYSAQGGVMMYYDEEVTAGHYADIVADAIYYFEATEDVYVVCDDVTVYTVEVEDAEEVTEEVAEEVVEEVVAEEVTEEEVVEEVEFTGFSDVAEDAAYYDAVMWAYENGVTTGYVDGTFGPADTCTRGQVVTFLWRAMGEPEAVITENPFTDVSEESPYYNAILWAVGEGITTGVTETTFEPSTVCTSAHVATFLYRAMSEPEATVESELAEGVADAFVPAINWAAEIGLLEGIDFVAGDASPRADIVTYLYTISVAIEGEIEA
ncbi:S-layer homology domain-containing protein [Bengtsoniella intestinalis]|uniref:S-layer homology domain-containing protein n=1 Tax=Bengtsoniella intestinalis TaxID=3073143 RepID=UPI00391F83B1